MDRHIEESGTSMDASEMFIYIIDYLIEAVAHDLPLVDFISKHLSWGLFVDYEYDPSGRAEDAPIDFVSYIRGRLQEADVQIRDLRLLLFSLLELISSSCHDVILYQQPVTLEEYKPYLYSCIKLLVSSSIL